MIPLDRPEEARKLAASAALCSSSARPTGPERSWPEKMIDRSFDLSKSKTMHV